MAFQCGLFFYLEFYTPALLKSCQSPLFPPYWCAYCHATMSDPLLFKWNGKRHNAGGWAKLGIHEVDFHAENLFQCLRWTSHDYDDGESMGERSLKLTRVH